MWSLRSYSAGLQCSGFHIYLASVRLLVQFQPGTPSLVWGCDGNDGLPTVTTHSLSQVLCEATNVSVDQPLSGWLLLNFQEKQDCYDVRCKL